MSTALPTETRTIEQEGATRLRATIVLGAGELSIAGGATGALHGEFATNVPAWRPEIGYAVEGETGLLTIRQPEVVPQPKVKNARLRWTLAFPEGVPLDLQIKVGAVTGTLVLGALSLDTLAIETGAGTFSLDLTAARAALEATVRGGVIDADIHLPTDYGARIARERPDRHGTRGGPATGPERVHQCVLRGGRTGGARADRGGRGQARPAQCRWRALRRRAKEGRR